MTTNEVAELYNNRLTITEQTSSESATTEISRHWDLKYAESTIQDVVNNSVATVVNFSENDASESGFNFNGTNNYIDLGSKTITVGNNASKGNGFAFETYVKSLKLLSHQL